MPPERPLSSDGRVLVRRVGSPPPKAKEGTKITTSPTPKKVIASPPKRVQSPERKVVSFKQQKSPPPRAAARRATSPPPKQAKRVSSPPPPKQAKKPSSPPVSKPTRKATSPPPKQAKKTTSPPPKHVKRATSPPPKKLSKKEAQKKMAPREKRPPSKDLSSALGNVSKGDVTTQLTNQKIEQMLDQSLVKEKVEPVTVEDLAEMVAETVVGESIMKQGQIESTIYIHVLINTYHSVTIYCKYMCNSSYVENITLYNIIYICS